MLTKLTIRNFKRFDEVEIELGQRVVFVGPNNSGKTTALQALALWGLAVNAWKDVPTPNSNGSASIVGVGAIVLNRQDLGAVLVPDTTLMWHDLQLGTTFRSELGRDVHLTDIEVVLAGSTEAETWSLGFDFSFANEESINSLPWSASMFNYALGETNQIVPDAAKVVAIAYLSSISGLSDREFVKQTGEINFLIGQGRVAEVLRNLCYLLLTGEDGADRWAWLSGQMRDLFRVELDEPRFLASRGQLTMSYRDHNGVQLDISSAGQGFRQMLTLLAYQASNPGAVLLLDEPDAHLEIVRQRQVYRVLTEAAERYNNQLIIATHSEVLMNEAAERDVVVAMLPFGQPHRIDDRGQKERNPARQQFLKSLTQIGYDQYLLAEQTGWVLYLEGSTDLAILQTFAEQLNKTEAQAQLSAAFVHYIGSNAPSNAANHFYGLRDAKPDFVGYALFDRLDKKLQSAGGLREYSWTRREIENYLFQRDTLLAWAVSEGGEQADRYRNVMEETINEVERVLGAAITSIWSHDLKVTGERDNPGVLPTIFASFYNKLGLPNLMNKSNFHVLARFVPLNLIDEEVHEVLDAIVAVAKQAQPTTQ